MSNTFILMAIAVNLFGLLYSWSKDKQVIDTRVLAILCLLFALAWKVAP